MSYTATATRGIAPTSLNLNIFSHPPSRPAVHTPSHMAERRSAKTPSSVLTDDEDIFSLDMVTMDMDFDQAYLMYTLMQQKNALMGIEQLQAAQHMNTALAMQLLPQQQAQHPQNHLHPQHQQHQQALHQTQLHRQHHHSLPELQTGSVSGLHPGSSSQTGTHTPMNGVPLLSGELNGFYPGLNGSTTPFGQSAYEKSTDEMDQFFSNTESNALEKFLDRLALLNSLDPLEAYQHTQPKMSPMFDLHTMGAHEQHTAVQRDIPDRIKKEITDAFKHPPVQSLKSFGDASPLNTQLRTPMDSRQSSAHNTSKRAYVEQLPPMSPLLKKKRKQTKPLLSLEQKRLNHSHSEQKRRLLCKEAYERCLRLITNVEDYKNDLVSASAVTSSKKKSKRKQINKEGLPNLSKHTALCKISDEIEKINGKNKQLRALLDSGNGFR